MNLEFYCLLKCFNVNDTIFLPYIKIKLTFFKFEKKIKQTLQR